MVLEELSRAGLGPEGAAFWLILAVFISAMILLMQAMKKTRQAEALRTKLEETRIALAGAEASAESAASDLASLRDDLHFSNEQKGRLEREAAAMTAQLSERERAMAEIKERMETDFEAAASKMLNGAHETFLARAKETFDKHQETAGAEADRRRKMLDDLIRPMSDTLVRYEKGLVDMRAEQQKSRGDLLGRIEELGKSAADVKTEAQKLSTALRAGSKVRGRWGEEQLRNVVETAGMNAYVDFVEQASHDSDVGRKIPDMVVNLPGARKIAVDSKVSLGAYLDAVEAENDSVRQAKFLQHADDLWAHVKSLSRKDYAADIRDSLEVVIMFVPGENYFAAAVDARPEIFQDAFDRKILIATPTTLVAMLKAASFGWRQEKAAANATKVASMAKDIHDSLRTMTDHMGDLGKALDKAVVKYNASIRSFEARVLPRARKFAEYELPGVEVPLEELQPLEGAPSLLRDARDSDGKSVA